MTERYKKIFKEYNKKLFSYKGRNVWDIEHSVDRFKERFPQYTFEDYKKIVEDGIDGILSTFKDSRAKYIIVSREKRVAVQLEWRRDKKHDDGKNHGYSATTLDIDKHSKELKMDTKLFVEEIKKYKLENCFESKQYPKMVKEIGYMGIPLSEECKDYEVYVKLGKVYKNFEIIEVK